MSEIWIQRLNACSNTRLDIENSVDFEKRTFLADYIDSSLVKEKRMNFAL